MNHFFRETLSLSIMTVSIPIQLKTSRNLVNDTLKAILHSILFHRTYNTVKPLESDLLDVVYPHISDSEIDNLLDDKISQISFDSEKDKDKKHFEIKVSFYPKSKQKKAWFGQSPFEQWIIQGDE